MKNIKFQVHPLFIILGIVMAFCGKFFLFVNYLLTILLHELGHFVVATRLGYKLKQFCLLPQGAQLSNNQQFFTYDDEIKIALAGPLVNVVLTICIVASWWIFPSTYASTETFAFCNITTAVFNFLPILPLDGGRCFLALFSKNRKRRLAEKICFVIGLVFSVFLLALFFISFKAEINFTFLVIAVFLLLGMLSKNKNAVYVNALSKEVKKHASQKGMKIKSTVINENSTLSKLVPLLSSQYYNIIYVSNEFMEIIACLHEDEIEKIFEKHSINEKIKNVI